MRYNNDGIFNYCFHCNKRDASRSSRFKLLHSFIQCACHCNVNVNIFVGHDNHIAVLQASLYAGANRPCYVLFLLYYFFWYQTIYAFICFL